MRNWTLLGAVLGITGAALMLNACIVYTPVYDAPIAPSPPVTDREVRDVGQVPNIVAKVDDLVLPEGVTRGLLRTLGQELEERIRLQGGVQSDASRRLAQPFSFYQGAASVELSWRYDNQGDYDQDGLVDVADLIPLALNLGRDRLAADYRDHWAAAEVADGNGDGQVNLDDLDLIARNYQRSVDNFVIYLNSCFGGANRAVANVALIDGEIPWDGGRREFRYTLFPSDPQRLTHSNFQVVAAPASSISTITWPEREWRVTLELETRPSLDARSATVLVRVRGAVGATELVVSFGDGAPPEQRSLYGESTESFTHYYDQPGKYSVKAYAYNPELKRRQQASTTVWITAPVAEVVEPSGPAPVPPVAPAPPPVTKQTPVL